MDSVEYELNCWVTFAQVLPAHDAPKAFPQMFFYSWVAR